MRGTPRLLLLQARHADDPMAAHERECFARALHVPVEALRTHDLLQGTPGPEDLEDVDLLLVGGSGDFSVLDPHPWIYDFIDFMGETAVRHRHPMFAACFGFQALVMAGGAEILRDPPNTEVGTYAIQVTEEGAADPLLQDLVPVFQAQQGHKDRARALPSGFRHLASSERVPYQAVRIDDSEVFATQFHPELTREDNILRYMRYRKAYGLSGDPDQDPVIQRMTHSHGATALLRCWLEQTWGPTRSDDP